MRVVKFFAFVLLIVCSNSTYSQNTVTSKQWSAVIKLLEREKWPEAEKMTQGLLKKAGASADTSYEGANLRYMFMVSVAAQLAHKSIDQQSAIKKTKPLIGKMIITPGRTVKEGGLFNYFSVDKDSAMLSSCQANAEATEIQIFEHYRMKDNHSLTEIEALAGKSIRIQAVVESIDAEGFMMPRLKVYYSNALYQLEE